MNSLRGKEVADNYNSDVKLYKSLGPLIRDYRQCYKLSQEKISELIGISIRELRNWETGRCRAHINNLHDLSEVTGIPMQVCVALSADQPIWYSIQKRRFAYSSIEAQSLHHELFRYPEKPGSDPTIKCERISTDKQISMVLSCHRDIYGTIKPLRRDVIEKASVILPDLNQIIFDSWGHYVGHTIWLPFDNDVYNQLKKQKAFDSDYTPDKICDIVSHRKGWILLFSIYIASLDVMHYKLVNDARYLAEINQKGKYMVAIYSATTEANELSRNMGLKIAGNYKHEISGCYNKLYEAKLDILMSPDGPWSWLVKEYKNKLKDKLNIDASIVDKSDNIQLNKYDTGYQRLRHNKNADKIRTKTNDFNKLYFIVCPNINCRLYEIRDKDNIVSNGTYHRKGKKPGRRYLCKECGKSFCNRTGTIFYDLRSPEENVLKALKLLAQGKPLSYLKEVLGVNFRTVRRWLETASTHISEINILLKKELNMSEAEINALLTKVNKKNISLNET